VHLLVIPAVQSQHKMTGTDHCTVVQSSLSRDNRFLHSSRKWHWHWHWLYYTLEAWI